MGDFASALISGAVAGLVVDLSLYPIDTIKTRLQSEAGFQKAGGFRGVYSGISSVAVGSAPGAAAFFVTYETAKQKLQRHNYRMSTNHMLASSLGEIVACLVRVPTEVIKQRSQAGNGTSLQVLKQTLKVEGIPGFYRGFSSTVAREIPFSMIQFPIWEFLKIKWSKHGKIEPWKSAVSGAVAGSIAAFITTPMDVAKTRIMLAKKSHPEESFSILSTLRKVYTSTGIKGLWAGVVPRVTWISIGGFIFLGVYDSARYFFTRSRYIDNDRSKP